MMPMNAYRSENPLVRHYCF